MRDERRDVFLDLKWHDIPTTVRNAARAAAKLDVRLVTVHASGGRAMLDAAVEGAGSACGVLAVTVLTSLDCRGARRGVGTVGQRASRTRCCGWRSLRAKRRARTGSCAAARRPRPCVPSTETRCGCLIPGIRSARWRCARPGARGHARGGAERRSELPRAGARRDGRDGPARGAHVGEARDRGLRAGAGAFSALFETLQRSHIECSWDEALEGRRRFFAADPWGNRLEFTEPSATPPG